MEKKCWFTEGSKEKRQRDKVPRTEFVSLDASVPWLISDITVTRITSVHFLLKIT
jgi:hypothetical protein